MLGRYLIFFYYYYWGGTFGTAVTIGLLYQPRMISDGDCGEIGGINIDRETEVFGENLPQRQFCPPKILHDYPKFIFVSHSSVLPS
jgi:hypothetical protein